MLSIGKLAAGQAKYYLDQAEVRVDVVDSVAEGAEDYYLGAPEARGEWLGSLGTELGLGGPVAGEDLRRVLAGCDPRDGSPLRDGRGGVRVSGFDLTFSAPKSVSVLFGVGDDELRSSVRGAHDRAVREALGYLERSAAAVRRGPAGAVVDYSRRASLGRLIRPPARDRHAEFLDPIAQRVRMHAEACGGAARTVDASAALAQHTLDVRALDAVE